jgi:hypothetical protein
MRGPSGVVILHVMSNAVFSGTLTWTPPGGGGVHVTNVSVSCTYAAQSDGTIDIPDTTPSTTAFSLAFGSIATPKMLLIKNDNNQDMGIRLQSAMSDEFQVPANSEVMIAMPTAPLSNPITAIKVVTTALQTGAGSVSYLLFGD